MNEELKVIITAEISDLEDNISQASDTVSEFATESNSASSESDKAFKGISASAAAQFAVVNRVVNEVIGSVKNLISEAMGIGDTIDKESQKLQMSSQAYQEWSYVCQIAGTDINSLNKGVMNITNTLGDLSMGVEADTSAFDALGVSLFNTDGSIKSTEDVLGDAIFALADMEDETQRNALAQDLFGRSFKELLPLLNMDGDAIEELIGTADEYLVISDDNIQKSAELADAQLTMQGAFQAVTSAVAGQLMPILTNLAYIMADVFNWLQEHQGIATTLAVVIGALTTAFIAYLAITKAIKLATEAAQVAQAAYNAVMSANPIAIVIIAITALIAIIVLCVKHWDEIKEVVIKVWNTIKETITNVTEAIKQIISNVFQTIHTFITDKVNAIKTTVSTAFTNIKDSITDKINAAKTAVTNIFNNISSAISNALNTAKSTVTSIFSSIHTTISEKINNAKEAVNTAINKIKSFFNFSWSLPKLKLPHISISGSFSISPPSVPHFSISWYGKGGVFDTPTLFPFGKSLGGLGENGAEAVVPLENNTEWLTKIADMLNERQGGKQIVLTVDGKVFAQTAISSINNLTEQTGNLGLVLG